MRAQARSSQRGEAPRRWTTGATVNRSSRFDGPTAQFSCPPAFSSLAVSVQDLMPPTGDARNEWGHVRSAGNGTSGRSVAERVLRLSESSRTRRGSPMPSTRTLLSPAGPPGSRPTPSEPTMRPSRPAAALPCAEAARPPGARRARETRGHLAPDAPPLRSRGGRRANHRNPRRRGPAGPLGHRGRGHRTADPAPRRAKAGRRSGPYGEPGTARSGRSPRDGTPWCIRASARGPGPRCMTAGANGKSPASVGRRRECPPTPSDRPRPTG